jgi:hypothetical protein
MYGVRKIYAAFGRHLILVVEREKMEINIFVTYAVAQEILYLVFVLMQIGNYQLSLVIIINIILFYFSDAMIARRATVSTATTCM